MGRPVSEIEDFPAFLSLSLNHRIQPRYMSLQHLGHNTGHSLDYLFKSMDEKFARVVAGTSLEKYMTRSSKEHVLPVETDTSHCIEDFHFDEGGSDSPI